MISVCLATYNGELFIKKQIDSILIQLCNNDELIIIDDKSTDDTINIINQYHDQRIKLYINNFNIGVVKSFEKALFLTKGDVIFLSDQDDFWLNGRVNKMKDALIKSKCILLISNMLETSVQSKYEIIKSFHMTNSSFFQNIYNIFFSNSLYFGSLMCFNKNLKKYILPFPNFIKAHDIHIALIANSFDKIYHLDEVLLLRTNTGVNLTYKKRSILDKFNFKFSIIKSIIFSLKYFRF